MVNLLQNPGFEEGTIGDPSHWLKYYNTPMTYPEFMYPEPGRIVSDSSVGIRFEAGGFIQSVPIDPTKKYMLSGYIKTLGIDGTGVIGIDWKDTLGNWIDKAEICYVSGTTVWTQYQQVVMPAIGTVIGTVFLELRITTGTGTVWFDDISIEETVCDAIVDSTFIVQ